MVRRTNRSKPAQAASELPRPTGAEAETLRHVGLTNAEAGRQFRQRTLGECCVYVLCWLLLVLVSLPADRQALQWAGYPRRATTVVADPAQPGGLLLQWIDPSGQPHDYATDPSDDNRLGQHVEIVDSPTCDGWDDAATADDGVIMMLVILGVFPAAGLVGLILYRRYRWRQLRTSSAAVTKDNYPTSVYETSWRTFLVVPGPRGTFYVPLMRGQRIAEVENLEHLRPKVTPEAWAHVTFRVAGTRRMIWPAGGCHTSVWPIGTMVVTTARLFAPALLIPLTHWVTSSLPC